MALFDNGEPEEFLLFISNFNMTIKVSGTLNSGANIQYLRTLVRGWALIRFGTFYAEVGSATPEHLSSIILGLGAHFLLLLRCQSKIMRYSAEWGSHAV